MPPRVVTVNNLAPQLQWFLREQPFIPPTSNSIVAGTNATGLGSTAHTPVESSTAEDAPNFLSHHSTETNWAILPGQVSHLGLTDEEGADRTSEPMARLRGSPAPSPNPGLHTKGSGLISRQRN
jgi:hypothetical protein